MYASERIAECDDPRLAEFRSQVFANHTVRCFGRGESIDEQAAAIYLQLVYAAYDLQKNPLRVDDGLDAEIEAEDLTQDEEIESLEQRYGNAGSVALILSAADALAQPSELAAREQCREADMAIRLGALRIARDHLCRAIALRPLDAEANYRLARLYIASRRRKLLVEAIDRLDLVHRMFERDNQKYCACDCMLLRARALIECGDCGAALALAEKACAKLPGFGRARYEYACLLMLAGQSDAARGQLLGAVKRYFPLWPKAQRDPRLTAIIGRVREDVMRWVQSHRQMTRDTLDAEAFIAETVGAPAPPPVQPAPEEIRNPNTLARLSCASINRQHRAIATTFNHTLSVLMAADERIADSPAHSRLLERQAVLKRREQFATELAAAQRSQFAARAFAGVAAAVAIGVLLFWTLLPLPLAFATLCIAAIAVLLALPRLSGQLLREQQSELDAIDEQLQRPIAAQHEQVEQANAARAMLERAFFAWRGSLLRQGRHQPYAEVDDAVRPGDLFVADRERLEAMQRKEGAEVVLQDLISSALVGDGEEHDRRLYRVVAKDEGRLVLSEFDAYSL